MSAADYVAPAIESDAFNCPHCGAYSHQEWFRAVAATGRSIADTVIKNQNTGYTFSQCVRCGDYTLWYSSVLIFPEVASAPSPADNMPEDVKVDYLEAREISTRSPRATAAILRLAIEKLVRNHLGQADAKDLN